MATRSSNDTHTSDSQPDILFTTVSAVFARLAQLGRHDDCLTVGDVSSTNFDALETARDRGRALRLFYTPASSSVVITVPSGPHNQMHIGIYESIFLAIRDMGLKPSWSTRGDEKFRGADGSSAEADSAGRPNARWGRGASNNWPTLIIEAGVSQNLPLLHAKMRWWFAASEHQVKIGILAKVYLGQDVIHIEKWKERNDGLESRQGATTTRSMTRAGLSSRFEPMCDQTITITITWTGSGPILSTREEDRTPPSFRVDGGPLIIGFEDLFLRPPIAANGEHDLVVADGTLQEVASMVWQSV